MTDATAELDKALSIIRALVDKDCSYVGAEARIPFASHGDAIAAFAKARAFLERHWPANP